MKNLIPTLTLITDPEDKKKDKIYVAPNLKGKTIRKALELLEQYANGDVTEEDVDPLAFFMCELYGNKFEVSDIYDGMPRDDVLTTTFRCIQAVVKMFISSVNSGGTGTGATVKPIEALNNLYREIIKQGWSMPDIDESDFVALMGLLIEPEEKHYINEIF
ncbi:MAG: hypothetical protein WCT05_16055 [Lentisphaeria bacterium]